jgi:hypothetical protein
MRADRLYLHFNTEQEAKEYILGFSDQIGIIRPIILKQEIFKMAKALIDLYSRGNLDTLANTRGYTYKANGEKA